MRLTGRENPRTYWVTELRVCWLEWEVGGGGGYIGITLYVSVFPCCWCFVQTMSSERLFVTTRGTAVRRHELECHEERLL